MEASSRPQLERGARRRPSGQPPPLPHHVHGSGAGWLIAAIALTAAIDSGLPHQVMLILGYVPRRALQHALQQRSGGRLHLT